MNKQQHFGESSQGRLNMQQLNLKQRLLNKLHYRGTCKKTFPTKHSKIINAFTVLFQCLYMGYHSLRIKSVQLYLENYGNFTV